MDLHGTQLFLSHFLFRAEREILIHQQYQVRAFELFPDYSVELGGLKGDGSDCLGVSGVGG